jgi:hypothetical protein
VKIPDKPQRSGFVEEQINEAILRGEFDNVKGKGKPLPPRPSLDKLDVMRQKLRHDAGFTPSWQEVGQEIDQLTVRIENEVARAVMFRRKGIEAGRVDKSRLEADFQSQLKRIDELVGNVNSLVLKNNLLIPPTLPHLHRKKLKMEDVVKKIAPELIQI